MIDTVIQHGSFGTPADNWFPWLSTQLTERGRSVVLPHLPSNELQNLSNWSAIFSAYKDFFSNEMHVYAHSLAPTFIVDFCVAQKLKLKKAVFVAPFYDLISIREFDEVNRTFFLEEKVLKEFRSLCPDISCIYSDDDPYVPKTLSERFAELTAARTHIVNGGKHLNTSAGYTEFPLLLDV